MPFVASRLWPARGRTNSRRHFLPAVAVIIGSLLLTACAKVDGTYHGALKNQSYDVTADLFLSLKENNGIVTGNMTIGAPLHGGEQIMGRRDGGNIEFATSDGVGGRIAWIGTIKGKRIEGFYVVEPAGLNALMNGGEKQQGIWAVSR